jgi:radical SAM superfamily enzyme YgiQ (UPF0313 family)
MVTMNKILLINPPISIYVNKTAFVPLPLLVLGTCLNKIRNEDLDFSYEVVDLDLMLKQGIFSDDKYFYRQSCDLILAKKPDILLFTVHGLNHIVVLNLSEMIKRELPSCLIVVGGVGPTLQAHEALKRCMNIDVIVKGEGETVLKYLIPAALSHRDFSDVPSVVYRKDGNVLENSRRFLEKDEPIPFPDYSLVRVEDYITHNKKNPYIHPGFVLIESGRGCPHRCSFCAPAKMWEGTVRYRPVSEIIEEMKYLAGKGGNFSFFTQDNLEENFLKNFSETLIKERVDISWGCYSRLDRLSDDMAGLLSKAGCKLIFTGFETPNLNAQKSIRKVVNSIAAFKKLQVFNSAGIFLIGSFIVGFTNETEEDIDNTMRFAIECATGQKMEQLDQFIAKTDQETLPVKGASICAIHPLYHMPGTDSFEQERDNLHITKYSLHPDCYGSYLFSYDEFKNDLSFLGGNPYLNHLTEDKARFYFSILRLFNFLNSRPFYFALLLKIKALAPLALMKDIVACLGEEFVLTAKIKEFETMSINYVKKHLDNVPEWTVKKGQ